MRHRLSTFAVAALMAGPLSLIACGDDDDTPGGGAGRAGSMGDAGDGSGGTPSGGRGGTGNGGGRAGSVSMAGRPQGGEPSDGGMAGAAPAEAGTGGIGGGEPVECDVSGEGKERENIPASIENEFALTNDKVWVINGEVLVRDGGTLTIPPCTRVEGLTGKSGLWVLRGGKLMAEGTADAPIVFTSFEPPGQRAAGDWGGIVLLGRAPLTTAGSAEEAVYEGKEGEEFTYGGDDAADSSGSLRYARIEFGGIVLSADKEVNGLSMAGVGSGTTIDHVMVSETKDDCFEWWGGSVKADYLICNNAGDDYFDGDSGWQGGGKYWLGRRDFESIDSNDPNGLEQDSIESGETPRTQFTFENMTLCGPGEASDRPNPLFGMLLRELVTGSIDNLALVGFEYGINTHSAFEFGDVTIANSKAWGLVSALGAADPATNGGGDGDFDDASIFTDGDNNELDPDPAPFTVEECLADGGPAAAVLDSGVGAFPDAAAVDAWKLDGKWVDWSED